ncbi:MAG: DoxX family protein [Candidatus Eremiobacteraeota bacterium]|nr:DoxX family protein [Candidatus Eremiobacteraeota bacterium]
MAVLRRIALVLLGVFFIAAGVNHFAHLAVYVRMIPPSLPDARALVQISGVCEILGGVGVLVPAVRRAAGIGLIALLIAVFPANVQMALHPVLYADLGSAAAFYVRLPLQLVAIAWVWWVTPGRPYASRATPSR